MAGVFWILLWTKEEPESLPGAVRLCFYGKIIKKTMQGIESVKKIKWS